MMYSTITTAVKIYNTLFGRHKKFGEGVMSVKHSTLGSTHTSLHWANTLQKLRERESLDQGSRVRSRGREYKVHFHLFINMQGRFIKQGGEVIMSHGRCCGTEHTEHCMFRQISPLLLKCNLPYCIDESSSVNLSYKKAFPIHQIFLDTVFSNCELAQTNNNCTDLKLEP